MILERKKEQKILENVLNSQKAEFVCIYGRRRVGKTFLISNFFNKPEIIYLSFLGLKKERDSNHRRLFVEEISSKLNESLYDTETSNWIQIFRILKKELDKILNKKIVMFIDELPRICQGKQNKFLEQLTHFWETYAQKNHNIKIIVSGSSASWIIENIINSTGSLYGRTTCEFELKSFSLLETKNYLKAKNVNLEDKQIAEIYMAIGGIPKYLDMIDPADSFHTAINRLFFERGSPLRVEFNVLFQSLFQSKSNQYKDLLISSFSTSITIGKTLNDIFLNYKKINNKISQRTVKRIIDDLVSSGFLKKQISYDKETKELFFLIDNYSIFYIYWIYNKNIIEDDNFWIKNIGSPVWNSWKGIAFESICLTHELKIKEVLGIAGISSSIFGWRGDKQIDLVIDRGDDCINILELKFYKDVFDFGKEDMESIELKIKDFKEKTKTKKSIIPIMITSFGCSKSSFYKSVISKEITLFDLMN